MKRTLAIIIPLLSLAAFAVQAKPLERSVVVTENVKSAVLGVEVPYNVYLPAGYDADAATAYPVIYLLHGLTDTYDSWQTKGRMKDVADLLMASGECRRAVIVMPNAGHPDCRNVLNGYFNQPGRAYEDFFFGEFIPEVEKRYRIAGDKAHRAIMGLSMGGGGSTVYCQRHPEMFSSCYCMSGWLDQEVEEGAAPGDMLEQECLSVHEHSALEFLRKADDATLEKLRTVKWFFDCGDDDYLLRLTLDMHMLMREKEVKSELRVRDGWHFWEYWHSALHTALPFASRNFMEELPE